VFKCRSTDAAAMTGPGARNTSTIPNNLWMIFVNRWNFPAEPASRRSDRPNDDLDPMTRPLEWIDPLVAMTRIALFVLLWLALTGGDAASWIIGIPAVLAATLAALRLSERGNGLSARGAARFLPFFLLESVRGGVDVARRVLRPQMRIDPGIHTYRLRLRRSDACVFFVDSVSLLPGTLSADLCDGVMRVHALDVNDAIAASLRRLEERVADLFGEQLEAAADA
jgi:multicomponent Na+:H+ antiporter subunit E